MEMMNLVVHQNLVLRPLHAMIDYDYHRINLVAIPGLNVAMAMLSVRIVRMKNSAQVGGVIPIMARFYARIETVSMKLGSVMVR